MAIELIRRPLGHKISITPISVTIVDNGAGDAVVYVPGGHSLSDGDYVYIESNFDSYNGYKYVDATAYDYFKIKNSENGSYIAYVQDAGATIYVSLVNHGWQGVHTPIAYELHSDISPVNEAEQEYNPNVVDSFRAYGGNTQLNLDHALSDPVALTWIELVGTGELAGSYQILTVLQPWSVVINLAYDATYDFSGYTIVKYYNNYHINVGVYAGLESDHRWVARKPFELAGTLKLIPDSSGNVKFSIHEILRGYIKIRNNLTLDTLPNNLDFHVSFYITYSESYDASDGAEITTFTGEVTTDDFIGHAVNAMMPFKSLSESFMSDYVSGGGEPAQWLTLMDRPVAVIGYFFDLSFLMTLNGIDVNVEIQKSTGGITTETENIIFTNPGSGVLRVPFIPESGFDQYCLRAYASSSEVAVSLSGFVNNAGPGVNWTTGATPSVTGASDILSGDYPFMAGIEYTLRVDTGSDAGTIVIGIYDDDLNVVDSDNFFVGGILEFVFTANTNYKKIGFRTTSVIPPSVTLLSLTISIESQEITEQLCIDIIEECGSTMNNDLRITDGSELRRV